MIIESKKGKGMHFKFSALSGFVRVIFCKFLIITTTITINDDDDKNDKNKNKKRIDGGKN